MSFRPDLDKLTALALAAGREIMLVRNAGFEAIDKLDGSPVTIADQRAEAVIEAGLKAMAPEIPMIGEESVAAGRIPACGDRFFCVDPLDGTRDFIAGKTGEFTVNIGYIENGAPVSGVVFAPATGELFAGEPGRALKGTFDALSGAAIEPLRAIGTTKPRGAWRVIASRHSGKNAETEAFIAKLGEAECLNASSSIKFCRLAEGAADLYPRYGRVCEWDVSAGDAVLRAAGGGVMRLDQTPLLYGGRDNRFFVQGFVAFATPEAEAAARKAM